MIYYLTGLVAITGYSLLTVLAKKVQTDIPSFAFITVTMVFLTLFSGIASLFYEKNFSFASISMATLGQLALFAFINFVAFAVMLFTIAKIPVVEYQLIAMLMPIISGVLAYYILSEGLSAKYFIGLIFIAIGLYIALKK